MLSRFCSFFFFAFFSYKILAKNKYLRTGATRVAVAKHFAIKDNETDIISKEGIQETFVTILGMIFGLLLTTYLNENKYEFIIIIIVFIVLTVVHVVANYYAVKSLELNTLNRERLNILITNYLRDKEQLLTPKQICKFENVFNVNLFPINYITDYVFKSDKERRIKLNLGIKINQISSIWMEWNLKNDFDGFYFDVAVKNKKYYISVAYDVKANDMDFLKSFLIYKIMENWLYDKVKSKDYNSIKPDSKLKIPSKQELLIFEKLFKMEDCCWYITNLRYSLCISPNRYITDNASKTK